MAKESVSKNGRQSVAPRGSVSRGGASRGSTTRSGSAKTTTKTTAKSGATRSTATRNTTARTAAPSRPTPTKRKPTEKPLTDKQKQALKLKREEQRAARRANFNLWFGLSLLGTFLFFAFCCVSYLYSWEADSDIIYSPHYTGEVANMGSEGGARISHLLIGRWLGICGLGVPLFFLVWMLRVWGVRRLGRLMTSLLLYMFVGSLTLGHFAGYNPTEYYGSGLGGGGGLAMAEALKGWIGYIGTSLVVILLLLAVTYYSFYFYLSHLATFLTRPKTPSFGVRRSEVVTSGVDGSSASPVDSGVGAADIARYFEQPPQQQHSQIQPQMQAQIQQPQQPPQPQTQPQTQPQEPQQPKVSRKKQRRRPTHPDVIVLNNGQYGFIYGIGGDGRPHYIFFDRSAMPRPVAQPAVDPYAHETLELVQRAAEPPVVEPATEPTSQSTAEPTVAPNVARGGQVELSVEPTAVPTTTPAAEPKTDVGPRFTIEQPAPEPIAEPGPAANPATAIPAEKPGDTDQGGITFDVQKTQDEEKLADHLINTTKLYDPTADLSSYRKPMVELMADHGTKVEVSQDELQANKDKIVNTLLTFGIKIDTIKATIGPTVTLYEIVPAPGVRISKIKNLEDDIALTLAALGIRIIAPIPGRGTVGIEVPNQDKEIVSMYSVVKSAKFQDMKAELPIALGKTIQNETFVLDLAKMPHLLVAGATGQGKSVGLNAIITSLLYKKHPSELKFVLVDPKKVELTLYSKLEKHFLAKMEGEDEAIITDTQKVVYTLNSLCMEMDARYDLLKKATCRNIVEYNDKFIHRRLNPEKGHRFLPYFVVIIDEFADLIMTAGREIETPIARIAQLARAVGIHLIIATQRPTTNIITGLIKANFPARIAFRVTSMIDSRTILDTPGANQLIGRGDMLVSTGSDMTRVQCAFIDTPEVDDIVTFIGDQRGYTTAYELPEFSPESDNATTKDVDMTRKDPLFDEVARFVVGSQTGSASTIQRKFSIGFNRAGRLIDQLEAAGIVGTANGSKPRQVLIQDPASLEFMLDE